MKDHDYTRILAHLHASESFSEWGMAIRDSMHHGEAALSWLWKATIALWAVAAFSQVLGLAAWVFAVPAGLAFWSWHSEWKCLKSSIERCKVFESKALSSLGVIKQLVKEGAHVEGS